MRLPDYLRRSVEREIEVSEGNNEGQTGRKSEGKPGRATLAKAVAELTKHYRSGASSPAFRTLAHRLAYLAVRLPATYACALRVFSEFHRLAPEMEISSLLDLGAGPGTASFAASEIFPSLRRSTMVEADAAFIEIGKRLFAEQAASPHQHMAQDAEIPFAKIVSTEVASAEVTSPEVVSREATSREVTSNDRLSSDRLPGHGSPNLSVTWLRADARQDLPVAVHDLVVVSYMLSELQESDATKLVQRAWKLAGSALAIIEPGTMKGFARVHQARALLIEVEAHIVAPCPHTGACPMAAAGDWCHFAQRLDRTSLHRQLKGGDLGYEDEKFSYIVASRQPVAAAPARIVRHPQKYPGHIKLTLCTPQVQALETRTVTKSQKDAYRAARKSEWGDAWEIPSQRS